MLNFATKLYPQKWWERKESNLLPMPVTAFTEPRAPLRHHSRKLVAQGRYCTCRVTAYETVAGLLQSTARQKLKKKEYFTKPYTAGNTRNLCKALPVTSVRIHRTAFIWVLSHALFNVHSSTQQKTPLRKSVTGFTNSDSTSPVTLKPFFDTLDGIDTGLGVLIIIKTRHWLWCKWMLHLNYLPSLLCFFKFILQ